MASWITNAQNYISSNTMKNPIDEIFGSKRNSTNNNTRANCYRW